MRQRVHFVANRVHGWPWLGDFRFIETACLWGTQRGHRWLAKIARTHELAIFTSAHHNHLLRVTTSPFPKKLAIPSWTKFQCNFGHPFLDILLVYIVYHTPHPQSNQKNQQAQRGRADGLGREGKAPRPISKDIRIEKHKGVECGPRSGEVEQWSNEFHHVARATARTRRTRASPLPPFHSNHFHCG